MTTKRQRTSSEEPKDLDATGHTEVLVDNLLVLQLIGRFGEYAIKFEDDNFINLSITSEINEESKPPVGFFTSSIYGLVFMYPYDQPTLNRIIKFCQIFDEKLVPKSKEQGKPIRIIVEFSDERTNRVGLLVACYLLIKHEYPIEKIEEKLAPFEFKGFFGGGNCYEYYYGVFDCVRGLDKMMKAGLLDPLSMNIREIFEWDDKYWSSWIVPGKIVAFADPQKKCDKVAEELARNNVGLVFRLNNDPGFPRYDSSIFTKAGIRHIDLPFKDQKIPTYAQMNQFLELTDEALNEGKAVGVHCIGGQGRTGTMIASYLIRKYDLEFREAIGFLRFMREGAIRYYQPRYLDAIQWWLKGRKLPEVKPHSVISAVGISDCFDFSKFYPELKDVKPCGNEDRCAE